MSVAARALPTLEHTFADVLPELCRPWEGAKVERPALLALNAPLADELGLDVDALQSPEAVAALVGSAAPEGARPVAMAYAGHQFGGYSPLLGDGRALLLGELVDARGVRQDLHLKGSGKTPFARAGDGKAAIRPMLREFAMGEAMHALGIPTTRALAVIGTNEPVRRETLLPGAVLARVAESHLRVGTFELAAAMKDPALLRRLADYAIARHDPDVAEADRPYLEFYRRVVARQAELIAQWMLVGFVHGVMNTDNVAISGQTIDYGPCAFVDGYDLGAVFSSIDTGGRYAYGQQPSIAVWNLARLGEALLPLLGGDEQAAAAKATAVLHEFAPRYRAAFSAGVARKLGLSAIPGEDDDAGILIDDLLVLLQAERPDFTRFFRLLSTVLRVGDPNAVLTTVDDRSRLDAWLARWREVVAADVREPADVADAMDGVNPVYVPRNHLVEEALSAATSGDLAPFATMLEVLNAPFDERPGFEAWAQPAPDDAEPHVTFCGT